MQSHSETHSNIVKNEEKNEHEGMYDVIDIESEDESGGDDRRDDKVEYLECMIEGMNEEQDEGLINTELYEVEDTEDKNNSIHSECIQQQPYQTEETHPEPIITEQTAISHLRNLYSQKCSELHYLNTQTQVELQQLQNEIRDKENEIVALSMQIKHLEELMQKELCKVIGDMEIRTLEKDGEIDELEGENKRLRYKIEMMEEENEKAQLGLAKIEYELINKEKEHFHMSEKYDKMLSKLHSYVNLLEETNLNVDRTYIYDEYIEQLCDRLVKQSKQLAIYFTNSQKLQVINNGINANMEVMVEKHQIEILQKEKEVQRMKEQLGKYEEKEALREREKMYEKHFESENEHLRKEIAKLLAVEKIKGTAIKECSGKLEERDISENCLKEKLRNYERCIILHHLLSPLSSSIHNSTCPMSSIVTLFKAHPEISPLLKALHFPSNFHLHELSVDQHPQCNECMNILDGSVHIIKKIRKTLRAIEIQGNGKEKIKKNESKGYLKVAKETQDDSKLYETQLTEVKTIWEGKCKDY